MNLINLMIYFLCLLNLVQLISTESVPILSQIDNQIPSSQLVGISRLDDLLLVTSTDSNNLTIISIYSEDFFQDNSIKTEQIILLPGRPLSHCQVILDTFPLVLTDRSLYLLNLTDDRENYTILDRSDLFFPGPAKLVKTAQFYNQEQINHSNNTWLSQFALAFPTLGLFQLWNINVTSYRLTSQYNYTFLDLSEGPLISLISYQNGWLIGTQVNKLYYLEPYSFPILLTQSNLSGWSVALSYLEDYFWIGGYQLNSTTQEISSTQWYLYRDNSTNTNLLSFDQNITGYFTGENPLYSSQLEYTLVPGLKNILLFNSEKQLFWEYDQNRWGRQILLSQHDEYLYVLSDRSIFIYSIDLIEEYLIELDESNITKIKDRRLAIFSLVIGSLLLALICCFILCYLPGSLLVCFLVTLAGSPRTFVHLLQQIIELLTNKSEGESDEDL